MKLGKKIACAALAAALGLSVTLTGCSLVSTNNRQDMGQVIAEVNISKVDQSLKDDAVKEYGESMGASSIIKRDLIAYFVNVGSSYINSGYSYAETFDLLLDSIIDNEVLTQYATMYLLKTKEIPFETFDEKPTEIDKYEYLLGGEDSDDVKIAKYSLYSSLNSVIDQFEQSEITGSDDDDSEAGTATRATPGNVGTEVEDYYPANADADKSLNYNVYTGYSGTDYDYTSAKWGAYEDDALDGTTKKTRQNAYNSFIKRLSDNYLIKAGEDVKNILSLDYVKEEYVSQLKTRVISAYYDAYEDEVERSLTDDYLASEFNDMFNSQKTAYKTSEAFVTAMGEMSDSDFLLYAPEPLVEDNKFGFVYNILLPFNANQNHLLKALQQQYGYDSSENSFDSPEDANGYYAARNALLKGITTQDQRTPWINGATEYAFDSTEEGVTVSVDGVGAYTADDASRKYLFFEDNLTKTDRFEPLDKYTGLYTFNGKITKDKDDKYVVSAKKLTIDDMLKEFTGYVDHVLGNSKDTTTYTDNSSTFYTISEFHGEAEAAKDIDYSKFIYASGKVDLGLTDAKENRETVFKKNDKDGSEYTASKAYRALSAVNELQYAYTTDTGVLSQYVGYAVSTADDTGFIKEFEYAAQEAVRQGAGAFTVCAGDYGWHLIYCTFTFDASDVSPDGKQYEPDWANKTVEGTFENLFYEWKKTSDLPNVSSTRSSAITGTYNRKSSVTKYKDRYKDLLNFGN